MGFLSSSCRPPPQLWRISSNQSLIKLRKRSWGDGHFLWYNVYSLKLCGFYHCIVQSFKTIGNYAKIIGYLSPIFSLGSLITVPSTLFPMIIEIHVFHIKSKTRIGSPISSLNMDWIDRIFYFSMFHGTLSLPLLDFVIDYSNISVKIIREQEKSVEIMRRWILF